MWKHGITGKFFLQPSDAQSLASLLFLISSPFGTPSWLTTSLDFNVPTQPDPSNWIPRLGRGANSSPNVPFGGGEGVVSLEDPGKPSGDPPIGGRLSLFFHQWESSISDAWVLSTIRSGLYLKFNSLPPPVFLACPVSRDRTKWELVSSAISHLLDIKAIQLVPPTQQGLGFYSRLFIVPKSSGGLEGHLGPKSLEPVYNLSPVQDAHSFYHPRVYPAWRFLVID